MGTYQDAKKKFYVKLEKPRDFITQEQFIGLVKSIDKRINEYRAEELKTKYDFLYDFPYYCYRCHGWR